MELLPGGEKLDLARFDRGEHQEGAYRWQGRGELYLEAPIRETRAGSMPELAAFLSGSPELGPISSDIAYGLSWLIVHFLITGEKGAYRERFERWLLTSEDPHDHRSLLGALGLTLTQMQSKLENHMRRLR